MDGYLQILNQFLAANPECIEATEWVDTPGGGRELFLREDALAPFCDWVVKTKGVPRQMADEFLAAFAAHKAKPR